MSNLRSTTPTIDTYIKLAQYPILSDKVRQRMRQEMFRNGFISEENFEREVEQLSLASQLREGLADPFAEEDSQSWAARKERVREFHTDALFAESLGSARLEQLIEEVLNDQGGEPSPVELTFNPEIAPWELLFRQGERYERLLPDSDEVVSHHLEEIKVVLIKRLMSDQLPFIGVAKRILTIGDLRLIHQGLIGTGKIGGKAANMILAWRALQGVDAKYGPGVINIPDSYFIGTDVIYEFLLMNQLEKYMNQKYLSIVDIRHEYPELVSHFLEAELPLYIVAQVRDLLRDLGPSPLIVRSSSLLEDNFGFSFAGKYSSYFCANQGTESENLQCVLDAIRMIYASALNPDALLYRKKHDLIDYDERMAILIQRVAGQQHGQYYYPDVAGLSFSHNPFCWTPEIRAEDGFMRLVAGLGVRAVERVAQDYPRLIPMGQPKLRPETTVEGIRNYSQRFMSAINLETGNIDTVPIARGLEQNSLSLSKLAVRDMGERLVPLPPGDTLTEDDSVVLTFDGITSDETFLSIVRDTLSGLQEAYQSPVHLEFATEFVEETEESASQGDAPYRLFILESRPLFQPAISRPDIDLAEIAEGARLLATPTIMPPALLEGIDFVIFIDPEAYYAIEDDATRTAVINAVTRLNDELPSGSFALVGPGRWGNVNEKLNVPVTYNNVCNSQLLVEISPAYSLAPEMAYGTDFHEDLTESGIFVLGVRPGTAGGYFNWSFFRDSANAIKTFLPDSDLPDDLIRLLDMQALTGQQFSLAIDDETDQAVGYLTAL